MLRQLKLTYFRQHKDRVFNFEKGLVGIRGPNEAGKSTLIESFLYALFGARVLDEPLSDVVTWGHKDTELSVEATLDIGGRLFNFKRSKAGAEAAHDGGLVTGQVEVSNFASELLGGDAQLVKKLMLATQNKLQGALEEGPKAVSAQIEVLADFDLFDRLLEAASEKLTLGSAAPLEARVKEAQDAVDSIQPVAPDVSGFEAKVESLKSDSLAKSKIVNDDLLPRQRQADANLQAAQNAKRIRETLESNLKRAQDLLALHKEQQKSAAIKAETKVPPEILAEAREALKNASEASARAKVFREFSRLMAGYPEQFWEGDREGFDAEIDRLRDQAEGNQQEINALATQEATLRGDLKAEKAKIVTSLVCPTCGQDVRDKEALERRNVEARDRCTAIEAEIFKLSQAAPGWQAALKNTNDELKALGQLAKQAQAFTNFATQYGAYVSVDPNFVPVKLSWKGETPDDETPDEQKLRDRISALESQQAEAEKAAARVATLAESINEDTEALARAESQLAEAPEVSDIDALNREARRIGNEIVLLRDQIEGNEREITETLRAKDAALADYRSLLDRKGEAQARLEQARNDLIKLGFNNTLVKKIRAARPMIADKLWSMTLAAVSAMFSQMRGERSVVTKDKDGFKVDGHPASSLSGSAKDVLGLAIRVALVKTFLPTTPFIVLDEPQAACDANRSNSLLAFVAAAGFDQTLVVSHDENIEAVADQLIQL